MAVLCCDAACWTCLGIPSRLARLSDAEGRRNTWLDAMWPTFAESSKLALLVQGMGKQVSDPRSHLL